MLADTNIRTGLTGMITLEPECMQT